MRRLLCAALIAAAALVPAAGAASHAAVTLRTSTLQVLYGHSATLSGRVTGRPAGAAVTLYAWRTGRSAPVKVAVAHTRRDGRFTFSVRPSRMTLYEVKDAAITSNKLRVDVEPALAVRELGDGKILATVRPALAGRYLALELSSAGGWRLLVKSKLSKAGSALFGPLSPAQSGRVRVSLSINQAGTGLLGTTSHALLYHAYSITLVPQSYQVLFGHSITLSGRLWNGQAGQTLTLRAWRFGHSSPVTLAHVVTQANGRWSYRVTPTIQTAYEAQWTSLYASARTRVGVAPSITLTRLPGSLIQCVVRGAHSYKGHTVDVQRLVGGAWQKIGEGQLDRNSSATFKLKLPATQLRVVMSVNEAGPGYLAGVSRTLIYKP